VTTASVVEAAAGGEVVDVVGDASRTSARDVSSSAVESTGREASSNVVAEVESATHESSVLEGGDEAEGSGTEASSELASRASGFEPSPRAGFEVVARDEARGLVLLVLERSLGEPLVVGPSAPPGETLRILGREARVATTTRTGPTLAGTLASSEVGAPVVDAEGRLVAVAAQSESSTMIVGVHGRHVEALWRLRDERERVPFTRSVTLGLALYVPVGIQGAGASQLAVAPEVAVYAYDRIGGYVRLEIGSNTFFRDLDREPRRTRIFGGGGVAMTLPLGTARVLPRVGLGASTTIVATEPVSRDVHVALHVGVSVTWRVFTVGYQAYALAADAWLHGVSLGGTF